MKENLDITDDEKDLNKYYSDTTKSKQHPYDSERMIEYRNITCLNCGEQVNAAISDDTLKDKIKHKKDCILLK